MNTVGKNGYGNSKSPDFSMFNNISKNPKDYIRISAGISKSKSNSKTYKESAVKSSIEGKNIAINSKEGSVSLEGTDITAKNLDIKAKEHIEIKAATEEQKSSNHSSDRGISASLSFDSVTPVTVTVSASGAKGRGNGTTYVNSILHVEETLKTESENLKVSDANIEADKVAMKAKDIVIESKQDVSKRKDSSYGASVSVGLTPTGAIIPKDISVNGSKGKGEGEWVEKQTSLIARNGGIIEAENKFTNTGAVIGSLSEDEKLKVSANEIEVSDLEDKNKYENIGGGISVGFDNGKPKVPNVKVSHDKIDKEQINRATAINTEFTIAGEEKTSEELGFNTDLTKAQEITKDEEKHLNADLHTDLANKEERDKLKEAGKKLSNVAEALTSSEKTLGNFPERYTQSTLAEGMADTIIGNQDRLSILEKEGRKDGAIDDDVVNEKAGVMLSILEDTLKKFGYQGKEVRVAVTDVVDPNGNTFTSTKEHITVLDREFLATATRDELVERIAHEFGHYTKEDDSIKSQKVAKYMSSLVMEKVKGVSSQEASAETYARIKNNENLIVGEKAREIANAIHSDDREYFYDKETHQRYMEPNLSKEEIYNLAKKYKVSEKDVKEKPLKFLYYNILDTKNKVFKNEKEFIEHQEKLKEKIKLETNSEKKEELEKQLYREVPNSAALYHNLRLDENGNPYIDTTFPNRKYVNNIGQEAVFSKQSGEWIRDGINDATYNIAVTELNTDIIRDTKTHLFDGNGDVALWENYGVGKHDKLTKEQRKEIETKIRYAVELLKEVYIPIEKSLEILSEIEDF